MEIGEFESEGEGKFLEETRESQQISSKNETLSNVVIDKTKLRPLDVPDFVGDNLRIKSKPYGYRK